MKIRLLALLSLVNFVGYSQVGQEHSFTEDPIMINENLKKMFPHLAAGIDAEEAKLEKFTADYIDAELKNPSRASVDYIIPVVFHILHEDGPENLTDTEIHDAMRILNEDFQMTNEDLKNVVPAFKNITGEAKIEFRLARLNPQGQPTNGIDRIRTSMTNNGGESAKLNVWPRSTYLNVWIVKKITSGAAGYTFLPSGGHYRPTKDGIILLYNYFSSTRTGSYRRSRALTHEIGHWLNLPHTWGSGNTPGDASNCSKDDGVSDTPPTIGWRSCNTNGSTCGSLDNVQNYMEYSYCSNMFTKGQVYRMRAALNSPTAQRSSVVSKTNNQLAGVLDLSVVNISSSNKFACVNESVWYEDKSLYGATSWKWEFEGGSPKISNNKTQSVIYSQPGVFSVKLTVTDVNGKKVVKTFTNYITINNSVGSFLPYVESFERETEAVELKWIVENEDDDNIHWKITSGNNAYSGKNYLMLENIKNLYYQKEAVISAPVDMSNISKPVLNFYLATASKATGNLKGQTKFRVFYSNDCGNSWGLKYSNVSLGLDKGKKTDASYVPQAKSDWFSVSVSNFTAADKVQNGLFKFEVENVDDNNFYIDNINITGNFDDVPVLEFPSNNLDSVATNVYLDWKAIPVIDFYEYELSDSSNFSSIVYTGKTAYLGTNPNNSDTRFYAKNLVPSTTYYWRVRAIKGSITSNWSDEWKFTISSSGDGVKDIDGGPFVGFEPEKTKLNLTYSIFPNPSNGKVNIELKNGDSDVVEIRIYSLQGQVVWENVAVQNNSIVTIDEGTFQTGIYIVNVTANGETHSQKLIIQ